MTLTLELPPDLEEELSEEAARLGLSLPQYVLRVLATGRTLESMPKTGSELVSYWQREGLIGSRPDIEDAQRYAREIRARAEKRERA